MKNLFEVTFEDASRPTGNEDVWIVCDATVSFADALIRYRKKTNDHRKFSYWRNVGPAKGESV